MVFDVFADGHDDAVGGYFQYRTSVYADDFVSAFGVVRDYLLFKLGVELSSVDCITLKEVRKHENKS